MGWWTDLAVRHNPPSPNHGGPMVEHRGLVVHIAEGSYDGTIAWQMNPSAQVSSHFVVAVDGRITQMLDTDVTAWTQQLGNGHWLSVENEGHTPGALTAAQIDANARLLARGHAEYGYPLQIASAPSGRGLGHHSMGAENGVQWGHSDCPGPHIIAQKPAILARAVQLAGGGPAAASRGETMRFTFAKTIGGDGRVYVTDGLRYRVVPDSNDVKGWMDRASGTPVVTVDKLPGDWTLAFLIGALCGTPDPGEQAGTGGDTADPAAIAEAVGDELGRRLDS